MPVQISELKYPSISRPKIIKSNLECKVNFLFNIRDNPDGLTGREAANNFQLILAKTNPSMRNHEFTTEKAQNGLEITFFDFTSYGVDEQIYNFMCLVASGGKIIQGVFNCP